MIDVILHRDGYEFIDTFGALPNYNDTIFVNEVPYKIIKIDWIKIKTYKNIGHTYFKPHLFLERK